MGTVQCLSTIVHPFRTLCILDVLFYIAYSARYSLFVLMCRKTHITHSLTCPLFLQRETTFVKSCLLPWMEKSFQNGVNSLTLLHSEQPKLYAILAFLSAIGLRFDPNLESKFKI